MAKPRLALILIPLIFLSSSLVPSYAFHFLITVLYDTSLSWRHASRSESRTCSLYSIPLSWQSSSIRSSISYANPHNDLSFWLIHCNRTVVLVPVCSQGSQIEARTADDKIISTRSIVVHSIEIIISEETGQNQIEPILTNISHPTELTSQQDLLRPIS